VEPDFHEDGANAAQVALDVITALERAGLKAAIGGSLALSLWGVPRGTKDADVNVFAPERDHPRILEVLQAAGCGPAPDRATWSASDEQAFLRRARDGEAAVAFMGAIRVDVFVPSIDFYRDAERTLKRVTLRSGRELWALSAEALCVFKLLFFREKDLVDLRRLVARQGTALDHAWVREHLVDMFPDGDERLDAWDEIVRRHGRPAD
jgi:hypothetical protein